MACIKSAQNKQRNLEMDSKVYTNDIFTSISM